MPTAIPQPPADLEMQPVTLHQPPKHNTDVSHDTNQSVKMKKEGSDIKQHSNPNHSAPPKKQLPPLPPPTQSHMKRMSRKTSKPIINWFQRKLAGTVRPRRASDGDALRGQRVAGTRSPSVKDKNRRSSVPSVPPLPVVPPSRKSAKGSKPRPNSAIATTRHNTISLNGSEDFSSITDAHTIDSSEDYRDSLARESTWSPTSLREADEDASVRPIPPSSPPSPSPSHSSSSYLSDPRTFASMAASTKPTTLLSVDLTGGMAHIAQAPPTPTTLSHRLGPHVRTHSSAPSTGGSITFSALSPPSPSSRPSSTTYTSRGINHGSLNAPQHTTHHPRNNPRPSSPPLDDASMLTLASSAFGIPGARIGVNALAGRRSLADDSLSHFSGTAGLGDSTSHFLLGELDGDDERLLMEGDRDGDVDASVRALRPRSSRRGSWESEASGWSAQISTGLGQPSTPSALRDRSLWTNGSYRTGGRSVDVLNDDEDNAQEKSSGQGDGEDTSRSVTSSGLDATSGEDTSTAQSVDGGIRKERDLPAPPVDERAASPHLTTSSVQTSEHSHGASTPKKDKSQETPKVTSRSLEKLPALPMIPVQSVFEQDPGGTLRVRKDYDKPDRTTSQTNHDSDFVPFPSSTDLL